MGNGMGMGIKGGIEGGVDASIRSDTVAKRGQLKAKAKSNIHEVKQSYVIVNC